MNQRAAGDRSLFAPDGIGASDVERIAGRALPAAGERSEAGAPIRLGSAEHKALFCRMLLDSFAPYRPEDIRWPVLGEAEGILLRGLPIWDIAVETENKASVSVLGYAREVEDPLLRQAIELNGFEEARHRQLLARMLTAYDIPIRTAPCPPPRDPEWAFMVTGFSECIDSFFAFGLFAAARASGLFSAQLADAFESVMQEECRHILFFVNWAAWHRRNLPWWRRPVFLARIWGVWLFLVWERIRTARDLGGNNFTMTGAKPVGIELHLSDLLQLCLAENERRLARYDPRLLRPATMPHLVRLMRRATALATRLSGPFRRES